MEIKNDSSKNGRGRQDGPPESPKSSTQAPGTDLAQKRKGQWLAKYKRHRKPDVVKRYRYEKKNRLSKGKPPFALKLATIPEEDEEEVVPEIPASQYAAPSSSKATSNELNPMKFIVLPLAAMKPVGSPVRAVMPINPDLMETVLVEDPSYTETRPGVEFVRVMVGIFPCTHRLRLNNPVTVELSNDLQIVCPAPCLKRFDTCGHPCFKLCGEDCGNCQLTTQRTYRCGHTAVIPCAKLYTREDHYRCSALVESKVDSTCGHRVKIKCHLQGRLRPDQLAERCRMRCDPHQSSKEESCGHPCSGRCKDCRNGRFHVRCNEPCRRTHICGHISKMSSEAGGDKSVDGSNLDPDDIKVHRIQIMSENLPDMGRWQKRLSETIYPPEVPGPTRSLLAVDRLYIQELPTFIEFDTDFLSSGNKYEIMTRMGKRLFIGCEVPTTKEDILFQIYDFEGRMIIEFTGRLSGVCKGTAVKVASPFGFLGAVLQGDQMCVPHYAVVNWTGAEVFTIHHPSHFHASCTCREQPEAMEYFVFTSGIDQGTDPTHVGTIARHLPRQLKVKDSAQEDANNENRKQRDQCCGITFPAELDIQSKILLMGALFVLDYRLVDRRGRRGKKGKGKLSRYFGVHTYAIIISVILIGGLVLIFYYFGTTHPHGESKTHLMNE